ncbi:nucleoside triphosphate pyrophosphatase [Aminivibrio sp.]|jgi:septum formation protein|uniref:Maf family protein n=1 Tax=Aminivibrio sp. TaxID=1872489 RepID=UPI001A4C6D7E|nr:Maf family protein [Aminivibrio sp.]MBL3540174.1 septum formation inhibitor Maf [Aminivibrio sp.]MDK2959402.1 nucleoside triphosphate pyrophosphatase [Synergistaceae bacterium]
MGRPLELILASGSPRRRELLSSLGWTFSVLVPSVDESLIPGESPEKAVKRLSREKAESVAKECPGRWVVAADTVVALGDRILGKPSSREEALEMLTLLNGRTHSVFTGVTVVSPWGTETAAERTDVVFRELPEDALPVYAESGEGDDKAGAYAIQGIGSLLVDSIRGDYFNVVGLPLCRLSRMLECLGFSLADQWRKTP